LRAERAAAMSVLIKRGRAENGVIVIAVDGELDAQRIAELQSSVRSVLDSNPCVEIDVVGVRCLTHEAISGLAACVRLGSGVTLRMARQPQSRP
jgi:hypothetical protein